MPISPLDGHKHPFHIAGSDAAGVVWAIGAKVRRWKVGDEVIVHCNQDDGDDEDCNGGDPMLSPSQRIWGYETPDGSFAQFCRVQSRQLMPKPKHLPWEEAACYTLTLATAYRMLFGHPPHTMKPGDYVLDLGRIGRPRRVRRAACRRLRRQGDRRHLRRFQARLRDGPRRLRRHQPQGLQVLGRRCPRSNTPEYNDWVKEARKFGKAIWDITGKRDVDIVFEHPGEATFPVSCLVVKRGGMVVFCAGTSGYNITFDARYVWMRQKRIQGSHFAHLKQASAANQFVLDRRIYPCMSEVLPWDEIPRAHQMMWKNEHKPGNMAVLVNAPRPGLKNLEDVIEATRRLMTRRRSRRPMSASDTIVPDLAAAQDRGVEFAAENEDRRDHVEEHQRDHRRGEARVIGRHRCRRTAPGNRRTVRPRAATAAA